MRSFVFCALVAAVALQAQARQPATTPKGQSAAKPKPDAELVLGNWRLVGLETGGNPEPDRNYRGNSFTFARSKGADTATLREGREEVEFAYKLDPTTTPKAIDLVLPARNVTFRGIYQLDEDDLTICVSMGGPRPTAFATKAGTDTELFRLRRDRWVQLSDPDLGFAVEMPTQPDERARDLDTAAGMTSAKFFVSKSEEDRIGYVFGVARLPGKLTNKEADAALAAARSLALAELYPGARARPEKKDPPPKGGGGSELVLTLDVPNSKDRVVARVRQSVAGDRLYVFAAAGPDDAIRPENLARFWGSFRSPPGKKGKN